MELFSRFCVMLLLISAYCFPKERVMLLPDHQEVVLNDKGSFSVSFSGEGNSPKHYSIKSEKELNNILANNSTIKKVWLKIHFVNLTQDSLFFIHPQQITPDLKAFELQDERITFVGETGFYKFSDKGAFDFSELDYIRLHIPTGQEKIFVFQSSSYKNEMVFPSVAVMSYSQHLKKIDSFFHSQNYRYYLMTIFFIGVHFCLMVLAISRFRAKQFKLALMIFALINLYYIVYYAAEYYLINFENNLFASVRHADYLNFLGSLETGLYYLFFWSYLDKDRKPWFRRLILFCSLFWLAFYFLVYTEWQSENLINTSIFVRNFGPVFDLIVTGSVFVFLLKYNSTFYKFARLGVFILLISAVQLALPFILGLLGISAKPPVFISKYSYLIMQICILLDFILFLHGQNRNEIELQQNAEHYRKEFLLAKVQRHKFLEQERERISHDMHDDLGAGISALKLQAEFLKTKIKDNRLHDDVDDLIKTSEEMNTSMREILWSLNSRNDTLQKFINYIHEYSVHFFSKSPMHLDFENTVTEDDTISFYVRRNLFLCLKEAMNNVYKHSKATQVNLSFHFQHQTLRILLHDNGIGFNPETNSPGNGLVNMDSRMKQINGRFQISKVANGTLLEFIINLPSD